MIWWIRRKLRELPLKTKRMFQSLRLGFNVEDTFSIDYAFGVWICPRLRHFIVNLHGVPYDKTMVEWENILEEMLIGFEIVADEDKFFMMDKEDSDKVNRSLELFKEHFYNLWD